MGSLMVQSWLYLFSLRFSTREGSRHTLATIMLCVRTENHWLCSLSKVCSMKHVCINIWLNFSTIIMLMCHEYFIMLCNSLFLDKTAISMELEQVWKLERIISKTNFYTFQDWAIFWNCPGLKVKRHSIGCVSLARLIIDTAYQHRLMNNCRHRTEST